MTDERMALVELLQKSGDGDFLRAVAEAVLQILMEADVEGLIGAGRHERSAERLNYRNGYRERSLAPGSVRSACAFPSCAKAPTSRYSVASATTMK
jgi:transposase-like protein